MKALRGYWLYDTHKAERMTSTRKFFRGDYGDHYETQVLYKSPNGRFFLHIIVEANIGWFWRWVGVKEWVEEDLKEMDHTEVQKWCLRHGIDFEDAGVAPPPDA
jgi:hypothetical protein